MAIFDTLNSAMQAQLKYMFEKGTVLTTDVDNDVMWDTYLSNMSDEVNPHFRTNTVHDCNCCHAFLKNIGSVITLIDGELVTMWDIDAPVEYQATVDELGNLVRNANITGVYSHVSNIVGVASNNHLEKDGSITNWKHFNTPIPTECVVSGPAKGKFKHGTETNHQLLSRILIECTEESLNRVITLINDGKLNRGTEKLNLVETVLNLVNLFSDICGTALANTWVWDMSVRYPYVPWFINSSIGTLVTNLDKGVEEPIAIAKYEDMVRAENYMHTTSDKGTGELARLNAEKFMVDNGLMDSLPREHAVLPDIAVEDLLFINRTTPKSRTVFDELSDDSNDEPKGLDRAVDISSSDFMANVLGNIKELDIYVESRLANNFVNITKAVNMDSPVLFKWGNHYGYTFAKGLAGVSTIKDRVHARGTNPDEVSLLRTSAEWYNTDDLDIVLREPSGNVIAHNNRFSSTGGYLNLDENRDDYRAVTDPVENITYPDTAPHVPNGEYVFGINNYDKRSDDNVGCALEIEYLGKSFNYYREAGIGHKETVSLVAFTIQDEDIVINEISNSLSETPPKTTVASITSGSYKRVNAVTLSPNCWGDNEGGNKHLVFLIDGYKDTSDCKGFFVEFLSKEFHKHRRVFELIHDKTIVPPSENQLGGLGFSFEQRTHVYCKVTSVDNKTTQYKINF